MQITRKLKYNLEIEFMLVVLSKSYCCQGITFKQIVDYDDLVVGASV